MQARLLPGRLSGLFVALKLPDLALARTTIASLSRTTQLDIFVMYHHPASPPTSLLFSFHSFLLSNLFSPLIPCNLF